MGGKLSSNQHHRNYCWLNFSFLAESRIALLCFRGIEAPHTRLPSRVQTLPYTETSLCLSDRTLYLGSQNRWKHISFNLVFAFIQFPTKVKVTLYPAPFLISSLFSHLIKAMTAQSAVMALISGASGSRWVSAAADLPCQCQSVLNIRRSLEPQFMAHCNHSPQLKMRNGA